MTANLVTLARLTRTTPAVGTSFPTLMIAQYPSPLTALLLRTNLDRTVQTPEYPYGTDEGWTTVHGKGSQIIGMFATLSRPFWDLGLISI
ncbi:hypothetical protein H9Q72_013358 [Fusarium xylarioides]|uniref:Uncharacterized protein n=1 Tax=Fusarium xylarioides TaxID=221167 RepID=A0A9P7KYV0_9HYPO|nr:hypothetical protein H9Q70_014428 [Fusarium xylarioides]KAG5758507.1 hypothetical protein H9Q72_013358 [Fusarium xylarioides]